MDDLPGLLSTFDARVDRIVERFEKQLAGAVRRLEKRLNDVAEDMDQRVDHLEEWHIVDRATTSERLARRQGALERLQRHSITAGIIGVCIGVVSALHSFGAF